ncbi:hypothetical protein CKAH01_05485 [Colletotrichum kahawae]|uniref:Uncharacterized protein n=1 Tax=Colletotrichum kahawae TaxID=34407 RepID=A0AAD9YDP2_COLKA|nr:hypothetical protein CKAH01_05485 [Colletotrichum kahawae]
MPGFVPPGLVSITDATETMGRWLASYSDVQIGHLMNHDVSQAMYLTEAAAGRSTLTPFTSPHLTYLCLPHLSIATHMSSLTSQLSTDHHHHGNNTAQYSRAPLSFIA